MAITRRCSALPGGVEEKSVSSCCSTRQVSCESRSFNGHVTRRMCLRFQPMVEVRLGSKTKLLSRRSTCHRCCASEEGDNSAGIKPKPENKGTIVSEEA